MFLKNGAVVLFFFKSRLAGYRRYKFVCYDRSIKFMKEVGEMTDAKQIIKNFEVVFILDRSGSMSGLEGDTIGGFNANLRKQRELSGKVLISTVLFDDRIKVLHNRLNVQKVPDLTEKDYYVGGCTAMLDAVGGSIRHIVRMQKKMKPEDRPEKTLFVIITDGMENASREYTWKQVKSLISRQREQGWEFLFLGANIEAGDVAEDMGIDRRRAAKYAPSKKGVRLNYDSLTDAMCFMAREGFINECWKEEIESNLAEEEADVNSRTEE